jgi:hypothetical protein
VTRSTASAIQNPIFPRPDRESAKPAEPLTSFSISVFSISAFTIKSFVQVGILDFTETDKVNYKAA